MGFHFYIPIPPGNARWFEYGKPDKKASIAELLF